MTHSKIKGIILTAVIAVATAVCGHEADSLHHYLQTAAHNNAAVRAAFHAYEAARQKTPQAGAYDDPQLEAGFFPEPMNLVDGREVARIQLMQMFPWFGVRKAARNEVQHMAQMAFEQFRAVRDNLYLEVYTQWYVLCRLRQKSANNEENLQLLRQLETLALRRFASGGSVAGPAATDRQMPPDTAPAAAAMGMGGMNMNGANPATQPASQTGSAGETGSGMNMGGASAGMSGVLRIRMEIAETESRAESLRSETAAAKALFNALLSRPAESEVVIPDRIIQIPYVPDPDDVMRRIAGHNPELAMLREESLAGDAQVKMAEKMGYPMFGVGVQYMVIGRTPVAQPAMDGMAAANGMNGKDMVMPMLSVSIPLYRGKYRAARKEAVLRRLASDAQYDHTARLLEAEWARTKYLLDDAARKISLYRKQAALARTTYDLAVQEFVSGKNDLGSVIQIQRQLLDYQLREAEATADFNVIVATAQKLISRWGEENEEN
jgi:outer membrane protein TolC